MATSVVSTSVVGGVTQRACTKNVVGHRACVDQTVGVAREVRHRGAVGTVDHVVNQLLLVGESVDAVLVFHLASQVGDFHREHAVAIGVGHDVVSVGCTPAAPRACHKQLGDFRGAIHRGTRSRGTRHVDVECHTHGGFTATAGGSTIAHVAAVVAHHGQRGRLRHGDSAIDKAINGRGARISVGELLLGRPTVEGELVLVRPRLQSHNDVVHPIGVAIRERRAPAAPSVERTVQVHRAKGTGVIVHVYLEGHVRRRRNHGPVVAGSIAGSVRIVGGVSRRNLTVGVTGKVCDRCT